MVDASVGGKTGVNLGAHKNQLGVFSMPVSTFCDPIFLNTLEDKELLAGKAEMLKHGLIASEDFFYRLNADTSKIPHEDLIAEAIQIKANIRSEEHTSELQSRPHLVCRLLLEKKN